MTGTDITDSASAAPTVLLTGPTSGIGAGMLRALCRHPSRPRLILLARDSAALERSLTEARAAGLEAVGIPLELSDLDSVATALAELRELIARGEVATIDAAILNAGTQFASRTQVGANGFERTFTINVIAQHLLVSGLEPLLAPAGHVVVMGSSTHRGRRQSFNLIPDPEWQNPADLAAPDATEAPSAAAGRARGGVAYASSKLALVTASHDWAERLGASGRRLTTYDPGLTVRTGLVRDMPAYRYWVWRYLMPVLALHPKATTARITGRHAVALALGDTHADTHGAYIEIGQLSSAEPVTRDPDRRRELLAWLDAAVAPYLSRGSVAD